MQGSALDEMVNVQHAARIALPIQEHRGLRRIVYSVVEDIPALLQLGFELPSSLSDNREHTLDVISKPLNEGSEYDIANHIDDDPYEDPTVYDADPNVVIEDISQEEASTPSVEELLHAACILQRAFRRCLTRQRERKKDQLSGRCLHFFAKCLDVVKKDRWERSQYKFYFLGPLPHVLACLRAAQAAVLSKKKETKKLLRGGDTESEALDDLNSQPRLIV